MKILLAVLLTATLAATSFGQSALSGTSLNIGTGNTTQAKSATIGNNNNLADPAANYNLLSGDSNWISTASGTNFITGFANGISGSSYASMMFGAYNTANGILASAAFGWGNIMANANNSLAYGGGNYVAGYCQTGIGLGLIVGTVGTTSDNPTTVVGSYNTDKADQRFVVGIGTDNTHRDNALEVSKTGKVTMLKDVTMTRRQGDLRMGRFGNPGDE